MLAVRLRRFAHTIEPAVTLLLPLVIIMFADLIFGAGQVISRPGEDLSSQYVPWRAFAFTELAKGHLPLWNPHIFGGAPFFAGFQAGLLYPVNWLYLFLPLRLALNTEVAVHVLLAGVLMYLWIRHRGASAGASRVGAAIFCFSAPAFAHVIPGHLSNLATMAWTPGVFLAFDRLFQRPTWDRILVTAVVILLQMLAGHPQYFYYSAMIAAPYAVLSALRTKRPTRALLAFSACYILAAALGAVQILSGMDAASESIRGNGSAYGFASSFFLPLENLLTFASPYAFGGLGRLPYWGMFNFWEMNAHLGVIGGILALAGAVAAVRGRDLRLVLPASLALVLALGSETPLYDLLYQWVPGFNLFRGVSKFIFFVALFAAPLAAAGFDKLTSLSRVNRRRVAMAGLAVAILAFLALTSHQLGEAVVQRFSGSVGAARWSLEHGVTPDLYDAGSSMRKGLGGLIVACGIAVIPMVLLLFGGNRCRLLLGIAAVFEVFCVARTMRASQSWQDLQAPTAAVGRIAPLVPGDMRVHLDRPNDAMMLGLHDIWGGDPMILRRYAELIAFTQGGDPDVVSQGLKLDKFDHPLLRLLRLVSPEQAASALEGRPISPVGMVPRVSIAHNYIVADDRDQILKALMALPDLSSTVALESEPTPRPEPISGPPAEVVVEHEGSDFLDLHVNLAAAGILFMTDSYSRGWHAQPLAGSVQESYEVMPADYALRGVPLSAGFHHLRLEYRPAAFVLGAWISMMSWAGIAAAMAIQALRRRKRGEAPEQRPVPAWAT